MKIRNKILSTGMAAALLLAFPACSTGDSSSDDHQETQASSLEEAYLPLEQQDGLYIPATFAITRPQAALTTPMESYFITGTSDPARPVYLEEEEIPRLGVRGTFGVHVELELGSNTFRFRQGDDTHTVTITREPEPDREMITAPDQETLIPSVQAGVPVGQALTVGCTAPSGATMAASFGDTTVMLVQEDRNIPKGYPAEFTGRMPIDEDFQVTGTQKTGPVTYTMVYDHQETVYTSGGDVYVAEADTPIAVQVEPCAGFVYVSMEDPSVFRSKVKAGAADYIRGQSDRFFQLASGGYLPKEAAKIIEGRAAIGNTLSGVSTDIRPDREIYRFSGDSSPIYYTELDENSFQITLYNTTGAPGIELSGSLLFRSADVTNHGDWVTYRLYRRENAPIWGYDVSYDGEDTVLLLKYPPQLSGKSQPLEGVTILVDPGHGGEDPGALGVAGTTGPRESDVNLAHAQAIVEQLKALGAHASLTREGDAYLSLDDRLQAIVEADADLFLSVHHNSLEESVNANESDGMEIYYHDPLSEEFAGVMMEQLSGALGRQDRLVEQSYYRVTLLPYAPSLLLELGFMSHPADYENATDSGEIDRVASAVAAGVLAFLQ